MIAAGLRTSVSVGTFGGFWLVPGGWFVVASARGEARRAFRSTPA
jgi:hypothetical protein